MNRFAEFDILAEFNSDFPFYFSASNQTIQPNQTDFEFVVTHELTHGLGFGTSLIQWSSAMNSRDFLPSDFLAPLFNTVGSGTAKNTRVLSWQPLSVYDSFLVDSGSGRSIVDISRPIFDFNPANRTVLEFVTEFVKSGKPFEASKQVFATLTSSPSGRIVFQPSLPPGSTNAGGGTKSNLELSSNDPLSVQTSSNTFQEGTSVVHCFYSSCIESQDFIMVPAISSLVGKKLDNIIANFTRSTSGDASGSGGIYGKGILSVMESLGWPTKRLAVDAGNIFINPNPMVWEPMPKGVETADSSGAVSRWGVSGLTSLNVGVVVASLVMLAGWM
jgi:hypothetical protein